MDDAGDEFASDEQINFHELEIFLEFSRTEHLGRTAEALGYSVSSIQRAVRLLERRFGVRLVQRDGRRVRLLHTGRVLADHAAQVMRTRAETVNAVLVAAGRRQTKLRLGHNFSLGIDIVPELVRSLLEREPEARIELRSGTTNELVASLLSGGLDAALISPPPSEPELEVIPLYSEETQLIVSPRDPLVGRGHVDLAEVRERPFVSLPDGTWSRLELLKACARAGFVPNVSIEVSDMIALQGIVSQGLAVSIIAENIAERGQPHIVPLRIDGGAARHRTVCLAHPRAMRAQRPVAELRAAARRFVKRPP